jgi:hypothetical protein
MNDGFEHSVGAGATKFMMKDNYTKSDCLAIIKHALTSAVVARCRTVRDQCQSEAPSHCPTSQG